jgi:hypothetical protein
MDYAPLIKQVIGEAKNELSLSEIVARVIELSKSVPSFDDLNSALSRLGREPVSADAYATALIDFAPVVIQQQKQLAKTLKGQIWLAAAGPIILLTILGTISVSRSSFVIAALPLGYALLYVLAILFPQSQLVALLFSNIGIKQQVNESLAHYQLKSGALIASMGTLFVVGSIWGRSALYASGVSKGDQPLLEVMLMIPMPLLGVTLALWGLGKLLKGMIGVASGSSK